MTTTTRTIEDIETDLIIEVAKHWLDSGRDEYDAVTHARIEALTDWLSVAEGRISLADLEGHIRELRIRKDSPYARAYVDTVRGLSHL